MDAIKILLVLVGAFYAFAGYVATRAALTGHFLDRAIAAIGGGKPSRIDTAQTWWMLAAATLVLAGGVALLCGLDIAVWLFLASAVGQALYLFVVAPRYFDAADPPDPTGRRQSTNAFVIYLAATAFVVWAASAGKLAPLQDAGGLLLAAAGAALVAHAGHIAWSLAKAPAAGIGTFLHGTSDGGGEDVPRGDPAACRRIKVMADYHTHPLWALDEDVYGDFAPEQLDISPELARDLNAWADAFTASLNPDDPAVSLWSDAQRLAHEAEARPLAIRLARERPDRMIYVLEPEIGVVEVHAHEDLPAPRGGAGL